MPNNPMTHDLTLRVGAMFLEASSPDPRKAFTMDEAIDKADELLDQLIASTLKAAADRVCEECMRDIPCSKCTIKALILAPLKEDTNANH